MSDPSGHFTAGRAAEGLPVSPSLDAWEENSDMVDYSWLIMLIMLITQLGKRIFSDV